ncbi:hypothetical protein [Pseudarthrobacter sp. BIM B-2242]|uniref:hypothetical protein n=1 Tax=Pseudarthrobacter sp. BIM B-2242 TaxID=2772401 RepID=UPI00168B2A8A|nr:hypothetical protein [Pseudarthrobacter sp. BIM B-2242]QOD06006.1 hypothetical protein IDT60_20800 [Pseudarthrobacter sp. BIM B-2242]
MTAEVFTFPTTGQLRAIVEHDVPAPVRILPTRSADAPLHEILRKAVVAHRAGEARERGSFAHRHHLAIAHTYLDAAAILAGNPDAAQEMAQCLDASVYDIRALSRIARDSGGPHTA